mgnify:CR=1 FL=1
MIEVDSLPITLDSTLIGALKFKTTILVNSDSGGVCCDDVQTDFVKIQFVNSVVQYQAEILCTITLALLLGFTVRDG